MERPVSRRHALTLLAGSTAIGLAGCLGDDEDDTGDGVDAGEDGPTDTDDAGGTSGDDDVEDGTMGDDDSEESPGSSGLLYAFAPGRIALIDPAEGEVVADIDDVSGRDWGDARLTHDHSQLFVVDSALGQVAVIDTASRELREWVDVGGGPVHAYHPVDDEMWVHSDSEGAFYVVDTEMLDVVEIVDSGLENEGHGKLVHHENLSPKAYATNTNDPAALVIDLENYERTDVIEVGEVGGTHYAAYAPEANRLYYEWFGGEMPIIDPETNEVVDSLDFVGGLALSPDETVLGVWNDDSVRFIDATNSEPDVLGSVELDDRGPDDIEYVEVEDTLYGFVANTTAGDVSVIDVDALDIVEHIPAGSIDTEGDIVHRAGDSGDGMYFTSADAAGTVAVIDTEAMELRHEVEVATGVDTVRYIPETT